MITIKLIKDNNKYSLATVGHANHAEYGRDIVCAGVSTLAQAFIFMCQDLSYVGKAEIEELEMQRGLCMITVNANIYPAYLMLKDGMQSLADTYPEEIKFVVKE